MPYVTAEVTESTKRDWEEFQEEAGIGSMSALIRSAVREKIQRGGGTEIPDDLRRQLDTLSEEQQAIRERFDDLQEYVEEAAEEDDERDYAPLIIDLAHDIADDLDVCHTFGEAEREAREEYMDLAADYRNDRSKWQQVAEAFDYIDDHLDNVHPPEIPPSEYMREPERRTGRGEGPQERQNP